jgi:outer membrane translocation and assembly module TamA
VVIDDVTFDAPIHAPVSVVDDAIEEAKHLDFNANSTGWINEFAEVSIRDRWQNHGYFRANASATAERLGGDSNKQHFRVKVHLDEGLQYHLGALTFADSNPFPRADVNPFSLTELRELIPLREGEIFDVSKIRVGIEALTNKYDAMGFIDFTAVPETQIDDNLQRISLNLSLDKQRQYRVGSVNVTGLEESLEGLLQSKFAVGDVFNPTTVKDFVNENRASLPPKLSERDYFNAKRNTRLGIVDLSFDFRPLSARDCRERPQN